MKNIFLLLFSLYFLNSFSQKTDILYLMVDKPMFAFCKEQSLCYGFAVKSEDKRFLTDYYHFDIVNLKGIDSLGNTKYYTLKEIRKAVSPDSIDFVSISDLTKNNAFWEVHNDLSLRKKIFLIEKKEGKFNSSTGKYDINYYILPMIYEGTRKNIVPTDLSN
ncbi:hypothetical protein [Bizionia sp.]|uniref:hypothetical protein n=1 Tax=Bizionia sp. TaxID=1954480 RepID=UPI003A92A508